MKYYVSLVNEDGCVFDHAEFTNYKKLRKWAAGRRGSYYSDITVYDLESERFVKRIVILNK